MAHWALTDCLDAITRVGLHATSLRTALQSCAIPPIEYRTQIVGGSISEQLSKYNQRITECICTCLGIHVQGAVGTRAQRYSPLFIRYEDGGLQFPLASTIYRASRLARVISQLEAAPPAGYYYHLSEHTATPKEMAQNTDEIAPTRKTIRPMEGKCNRTQVVHPTPPTLSRRKPPESHTHRLATTGKNDPSDLRNILRATRETRIPSPKRCRNGNTRSRRRTQDACPNTKPGMEPKMASEPPQKRSMAP